MKVIVKLQIIPKVSGTKFVTAASGGTPTLTLNVAKQRVVARRSCVAGRRGGGCGWSCMDDCANKMCKSGNCYGWKCQSCGQYGPKCEKGKNCTQPKDCISGWCGYVGLDNNMCGGCSSEGTCPYPNSGTKPTCNSLMNGDYHLTSRYYFANCEDCDQRPGGCLEIGDTCHDTSGPPCKGGYCETTSGGPGYCQPWHS